MAGRAHLTLPADLRNNGAERPMICTTCGDRNDLDLGATVDTDHDDARIAATRVIDAIDVVVSTATRALAADTTVDGRIDATLLDLQQPLLYEIATISAAAAAGRSLIATDGDGDLALVHAAGVAADLLGRLTGRDADLSALDDVRAEIAIGRGMPLQARVAARVVRAGGEVGGRGLGDDLEMVRQSFRRFAEEHVAPIAEQIHRDDADIPEEIISGLAELGCFALSVPEEHGGLAGGGDNELLGMVVVTEELSRASLGVAGSLITRPEIVATAIARGGTPEQQERWLPRIASGEAMTAVAITEPDAGSDVASLRVTARRDGDGWTIDGVKTWCTFAGRAEYLLVLARTDSDPAAGHRGLSLFVLEKPAFPGHHFETVQEGGGRMEGRAIATIGYRGMHSFEVAFDGWRAPLDSVIGGDAGLGRGFYLQMQAFANARLQTAARAQGLMQAALEDASAHVDARHVFSTRLADLPLTQERIARMAATLAACRAAATDVARAIASDRPDAAFVASQVKLFACRSAEWVTRDAQQLHGGYGYAEEYRISRLFVDARVLPIFEGTDEVLALKVIGRELVARASADI